MRSRWHWVAICISMAACDRVGEIEKLASYEKGAEFVGEGSLSMQVRHFRQIGNDNPEEQIAFAFDSDESQSITQQAQISFDRSETVIGVSELDNAVVMYSEVHTSNYDVEASLELESEINDESIESTTDLSMDLPDSVALVQRAGETESGLIWGATLQGHDPLTAFASLTVLSGAQKGDVWGDFPLEQRSSGGSAIDVSIDVDSLDYCEDYDYDSMECQLQQLLGATLFGTEFGLHNVYEAAETEEMQIKLDGVAETIEAQKISVYFLNSIEADRVQDCFSEVEIKYESDGGVVIDDTVDEPEEEEEAVVNFQCPPVLESLDLWTYRDLIIKVSGSYSVMAPDRQYVPFSSSDAVGYYDNYGVDPGYGWEMFGVCESTWDSTQFDVRLFAFSKTLLDEVGDDFWGYYEFQCDYDTPQRYAHYTLTDVELQYAVSQITTENKDTK